MTVASFVYCVYLRYLFVIFRDFYILVVCFFFRVLYYINLIRCDRWGDTEKVGPGTTVWVGAEIVLRRFYYDVAV